MEYKLFNYNGNKDREMNYILPIVKKIIKEKNITTIVEPFGGSFSLIRHLFKEYGNKLKYHVNDIDDFLINVYKTMINPKNNKKICDKIKTLELTVINKEKMKELDKKDVSNYIFGHIKYNLRPFFYPANRKVNINYERLKLFTIFNKVKFTNLDYKDIFNKYKNRTDVLLFLDPPYFLSYNDHYEGSITESFFTELQNIDKYKFQFLKVVKSSVLCDFFMEHNNFKKLMEYPVKYQRTRKLTNHIIWGR